MSPEELESIKNAEFKKISGTFTNDLEPLMLILKAHLYSENLLERVILINLHRGDKVIDSGSFSYHHKLLLCEATDSLPDFIISSLRNLNKIRNKCAHQLDKEISDSDITKIGSPLGKEFTRMRKECINKGSTKLLCILVIYICSFITGKCYSLENE